MQLVMIYSLGAVLAAAMAIFGGAETPIFAYWLYLIGALAFIAAAVGQYFKLQKPRR